MEYSNLTELRQRMAEQRGLQADMEQLCRQIETMEEMIPALEAQARAEQEDVTRMEQGGVVSLFYSAIGRHEEKLDRERQEAYAAEIKYRDALRTLDDLRGKAAACQKKLNAVGDCARAYVAALAQKQQEILTQDSPAAQELRRLTSRARQIETALQEIREALDAGCQVRNQLTDIEDTLKSASNWGMVDMIGGGFLSDMAKYSKLDEAKSMIRELNHLLERYASELKDLNIDLRLSANVGDGLRFADFFFDGFIADSMALDRINRMKEQISEIRSRTDYYMDLLTQRRDTLDEEKEDLKQQAENLIISA